MSSDLNTVCVVDDDPAIRDSMMEMLSAAGLAAETYPSADAFLDAFEPSRVGCAVLDVYMPGIDGLDLCEKLRKEHPYIPIIIVTGHGDVAKARRSFKMGAVDFIEKPFSNRQLLTLIRETIGKGARDRYRSEHRKEIAARIKLLSEREREVMDLVLKGFLNKQMAAALGVHERTIEFHRKNIMKKMQAKSTPELVTMALACRSDDPLV